MRNTIFRILTIFLFVFSINASSSERLIGKGILEFPFFGFDLYEISYFIDSKKNSEKVILEYKVNVSRKHSQMGWDKGLSHLLESNPELIEKINWIKENTFDVKKGDIVIISKKDNFVSITKNKNLISQIKDKEIANIILEPWIGQKPVDKELKNQLLNKET